MGSNILPHGGHRLYFSRGQAFRQKTFRLCDRLRHRCGDLFFEKVVKTDGGHRALGSPWVGSISARMQGRSLLSLKRSRLFRNMATDKFFELIDI
jgi:hypothetical protein